MCPFQYSLSVWMVYAFPVLCDMTKSMLQLSTGRRKLCTKWFHLVRKLLPNSTLGWFRIPMTAYAISSCCSLQGLIDYSRSK